MKFAKKLLAGVLAAAITFSCFITLSYATDGGDAGQETPVKTVNELFIEEIIAVDLESTEYATLKTQYDALTVKKNDPEFDSDFEGMSVALQKYDALGIIVAEYENFNEDFITSANAVDLSGDYTALKAQYVSLTEKKANVLFDSDYEGVAAAVEKYELLEDVIEKHEFNVAFIVAVNAVDLTSKDYVYLVAHYEDLTERKNDAKFDSNFTDMAAALEKYAAIETAIQIFEDFSETFINSASLYNPDNKDYAYMTTWRDNLDLLFAKASTTYPGMADAIATYNALKAKVLAIETNANKFINAVSQMTVMKAGSVSATAPYLTTNFADLYAKYSTAMTVYADGTVHPGLDASTYPGLSEKVTAFAGTNGFKLYVEGRILDCVTFVNAVMKAKSSSNYVSKLAELDKAALYLDSNVEKSLENYTGVADAVTLYATLRKELADNVSDANAYIAAVNAINMTASYSALKSAVAAANALREKGNIPGIAGVQEANVKFSAAEAKVISLEGNSKTLIDAVTALKEAKTVSERRELIFIAINAKDKAEDSITGVTDAKAELQTQIEKFNTDVAAANAEFFAAVQGTCTVTASTVPFANAYKTVDIFKVALK